jgi:hypothetical protein
MLHTVDHEHFHWPFGRFQCEPELLLKSLKERGSWISAATASRLSMRPRKAEQAEPHRVVAASMP